MQASLGSVRLACVKHAASVHPEPGSNSRLKCSKLSRLILALVSFFTWFVEPFFRIISLVSISLSNRFIPSKIGYLFKKSSGLHYCFFVKVLVVWAFPRDSIRVPPSVLFVNNFFEKFLKIFKNLYFKLFSDHYVNHLQVLCKYSLLNEKQFPILPGTVYGEGGI